MTIPIEESLPGSPFGAGEFKLIKSDGTAA
jgi:hypothetical protein